MKQEIRVKEEITETESQENKTKIKMETSDSDNTTITSAVTTVPMTQSDVSLYFICLDKYDMNYIYTHIFVVTLHRHFYKELGLLCQDSHNFHFLASTFLYSSHFFYLNYIGQNLFGCKDVL